MPPFMSPRSEPRLAAPPAHLLEPAAPTLQRHSLLHPPVVNASRDKRTLELIADVGTVWKSDRGVQEEAGTLLTLRYFAVQAMQLRLEQLLQGRGQHRGDELDFFLDGRFDQAYVDAATYQCLALGATGVLGEPDALPVFFDLGNERLVVDTTRFFNAGVAEVTAAAVHGVVAMAQSSRFMAWLEAQPLLTDTDMVEATLTSAPRTLLDAARCVTRYVLTEPGLELSPPAEQLARRVGAKAVMRALLTGAVEETRATVLAFGSLCKQGLWHPHPALR